MKGSRGFLLVLALITAAAFATTAMSATFYLPSGVKAYIDRDGNKYTADVDGKVTLPAKYTNDAFTAGLTQDAPIATFINSTTAVGTCTKGQIRLDYQKNLQVCYSSNVSPGWKKLPLK